MNEWGYPKGSTSHDRREARVSSQRNVPSNPARPRIASDESSPLRGAVDPVQEIESSDGPDSISSQTATPENLQQPARTGHALIPDFEEERRRAAAVRSYTTPAVITLILYFVLWLPGLIVNFVYLSSASHDARLSGYDPEGKGCLTALLWVFGILPIVLGVITVFVIFAAFGSGG